MREHRRWSAAETISIYFHHNQTATRSLGTPNPCALPHPPPQQRPLTSSRSPKVLRFLPAGAGTLEAGDPAGERFNPSIEPGDAGGPSPEAGHAGFNFTEPRGDVARRDPRVPQPRQPGSRQRAAGSGHPPPQTPSFLPFPRRGVGGGGAKGEREKKKSSPPISVKQTFFCYFLSSPGFRGRVLPGGLGCGQALRGPGPRVLEIGLLCPLAERAPCHPPNFSTRRRREGERPG